ncbi:MULTISPECIES: accessory gene regulator B family protein [Clostridium]|uniref:Putative agrB-like protein, putative n=1 Tax=Clostridium novyi (strain NT) TaxID=386415 RepID=A0Q0I1_CLONN|nr:MULTISPECIES: accessory gene regulator B family protein [Clostridium]ABK61931.1 Putative agrB-like protein, putative [Clostridium novyi NT]KEH84846.1 accessory gene regulator AgrB [Clostridium novyi A str. 4540]KEH85438.1 accessory gene regulator AgrB [Clostridium novyi A str. NCTC 538]KEH90316.1 accessory gene regulator AgrB [Clostridium novyi A str. GD211209]KEH91270.1 accessory gene regulator AgrB [Clostridium botulinum C/D str. It1]
MKLSEKFSEKVTTYVKNTLPNKTEEDLEIIKYGVELLFMNFTKLPLILIVGYMLNIFKMTVCAMIIFSVIRRFAAGIHARKSYTCLASTMLVIYGSIYLSLNFKLSNILKIIIFCICFIIYLKYSPADTEEKPYLNKNLRKKLKVKSIAVIILYFLLSLVFNKNMFISNILIHFIWIEGILILPLTYKIFNRRYNNYENYE